MKSVSYESLACERPVYIIAEAGVNHCGDINLAARLAAAAAEAGADAVKFQTFVPELVVSRGAEKMRYQKQPGDNGETQLDMLSKLCLDAEAHRKLVETCDYLDITFVSTPFDEASADLLDELGVPFFKIGSGDLTNLPFLEYVAAKGRPMVVSTGMAYLHEVEEAVQAIYSTGNKRIVLLHCVTNYPAADGDANLRAMKTMADHFGLPVGYSDHTRSIEIALAAAGLGARVVEKHLTLNRKMEGPDHAASLEPYEFREMVNGIRRIERALGTGEKRPAKSEEEGRKLVRRSLFAARDIEKDTLITPDMLCAKRPGTYIEPKYVYRLAGRRATCRIAADEPITWENTS